MGSAKRISRRVVGLLVLVGGCVGTILISSARRHEVRYTIRGVGMGLGWGSSARSINASGDVLGSADGVAAAGYIFVDRGGVVIPVSVPGDSVQPVAINDRGDALSSGRPPSGAAGFLWRHGKVVPIRFANASFYPSGLNNSGTVVGVKATGRKLSGVLWRDGRFTAIEPSSSASGYLCPARINDTNMAVGFRNSRSRVGPAVMWKNGVERLLVTPPRYLDSMAAAVNNREQAVGVTYLKRGRSRAVRACKWDHGVFTDMGTLDGDSIAEAINNHGVVVGASEVRARPQANFHAWRSPDRILSFDWPRHAVVWEDGRPRDLNERIPRNSGWLLESATAVNDADQIVGTGIYNGQKRGFVLTPVRRGQ